MSTYCVSDIHGYYNHFMSLLDKIEFSIHDTLYIIGDIIDRGPDTRRLLKWLIFEAPKNIIMLKGNHEDMLVSYLTSIKSDDPNICRPALREHPWTWNSRQQKDIDHIWSMQHDDFWFDAVLPYLDNLPIYKDIVVNNHRFLLVHAGFNPTRYQKDALWCRQDCLLWPGADWRDFDIPDFGIQDTQTMLWARDYWYDRNQNDPAHVVCGHTPNVPTHLSVIRYKLQYVAIEHDLRPHQISHVGTRHLIDCGSGHRRHDKRGDIGILRLDDLAAFYNKTPSPVYPTNEYLTWFYKK